MNQTTETRSRSTRTSRAGWLLLFLCIAIPAFIGGRHVVGANTEAQRTAAIAKCRDHQRSLADAIAAYRSDHSGDLPRALGDLYPAYASADLFTCPLAAPESATTGRNSAGEELTTSYHYIPQRWGREDAQTDWPWRVFMDEIVPENADRLQLLRCAWHNVVVDGILYVDAIMVDGRLADAPYLVDDTFGRFQLSPEEQEFRAESARNGMSFPELSPVMPPILRYR